MIKPGLIPRNNWDYTIADLCKALWGIIKPVQDPVKIFKEIFHNEPIFTTSGRTSLYAILKSLNLPSGATIGVPLYCCPVVFNALKQANLTPLFIDINSDDYNISITDLAEKKGSLSALIVVHMFGYPADMDSITSIVKGIPVIEDCAHSLFSKYKNQYTGTLSTASFFSFRSGKYLSSGEGSVIFCKDPLLHRKIATMVKTMNHWLPGKMIMHCIATYIKSLLYKRPWYGIVGYPIGRKLDSKFNLSAKTGFNINKIAGSDFRIIHNRISTFQKNIEKQRENSVFLKQRIKCKNVSFPKEKDENFSNCYLFPVKFENTKHRDAMADHLFKYNIDTAKYLDEVTNLVQKEYGYIGGCPQAEHCSKTVLLIPHFYTLSTKDLDHIAHCFNELT